MWQIHEVTTKTAKYGRVPRLCVDNKLGSGSGCPVAGTPVKTVDTICWFFWVKGVIEGQVVFRETQSWWQRPELYRNDKDKWSIIKIHTCLCFLGNSSDDGSGWGAGSGSRMASVEGYMWVSSVGTCCAGISCGSTGEGSSVMWTCQEVESNPGAVRGPQDADRRRRLALGSPRGSTASTRWPSLEGTACGGVPPKSFWTSLSSTTFRRRLYLERWVFFSSWKALLHIKEMFRDRASLAKFIS